MKMKLPPKSTKPILTWIAHKMNGATILVYAATKEAAEQQARGILFIPRSEPVVVGRHYGPTS